MSGRKKNPPRFLWRLNAILERLTPLKPAPTDCPPPRRVFLRFVDFVPRLRGIFLYFIKMFWYFVGIAVISAIVILHRSKTVGESDSDSEWEAEPGQILNADVYNPFARFNS